MNRLHATKDFWLAALRADSPALQDAVAQAGPDRGGAHPARAGPCADLVEHLTGLLHWVRETVPRGVTDRPDDRADPPAPAPEWDEALDGLRRELTGTIETLEALDADFPAWNWAPQAKTAGFWHRRMAHEISVHRWDAEAAAGRATPIETKLAADGVSEVLDTWLPAGRRKGPPTCTASCTWWPATPGTSGSSGCAAPGWRCSTPARSWTATTITRGLRRPAPRATCCSP